MSIWDERILEYLTENKSGSPTKLAEEEYFHITKSQVSNRLRTLADHELLESLGNGVYIITDKGTRYLEGRYNAETDELLIDSKHTHGVSTAKLDNSK